LQADDGNFDEETSIRAMRGFKDEQLLRVYRIKANEPGKTFHLSRKKPKLYEIGKQEINLYASVPAFLARASNAVSAFLRTCVARRTGAPGAGERGGGG